ncbi:hypothetical protein QCA50_013119 [Cerrena zonata]|uniref:Uncharacterized protein n=1 Tax=Cerrena zonata TaxID=2478898 RepID=A0AAW0FRR7_9APHY
MSSGSSSSASDPPFSYSMFDGLMVCYSIACMFYGITVAQAYVYFRSPEKDPKWTTWMAGLVIGLETIHTAFFLQQMIFYLDYWTYLWWLVIQPPIVIL